MLKASSLSFQAAVVLVVSGMIWGIAMGISGDHAAMPAHAHLNLLGWVSLFLFGIFYHLHPATDRSRTALTQVLVWIVGPPPPVRGAPPPASRSRRSPRSSCSPTCWSSAGSSSAASAPIASPEAGAH